MRHKIDVPPLWLLAAILLAWLQSHYLPLGLGFGGAWADFCGGLLVGGGLLLVILSAAELRRQKTTLHPHETPARLVQGGIYSRSRNPIYLGGVLILTGMVLRFDAVLSLPVIAVFIWLMERRFILPEEKRLRREFGADWARYEQKVRRWL